MQSSISVIVPVYNTAQYLDKCLNSLAAQTLDDIEIIVVNDGSTDNSQDIIDEYVNKYPDKFIVTVQENKGLGAARNTGVANARGDYIGFVDSDDYVSPDMFKSLLDAALLDSSDVVLCDYTCIYAPDMREQTFQGLPGCKDNPCSVSDYVLAGTNPAYSCIRIYKKELLIKIPFPAGYYEDIATTPIILSNCKKISYVRKPFYYYLRRESTISQSRFSPKNLKVIDAWKRCLVNCNDTYKKEVAFSVFYSISEFIEYKPDCALAYIKFFKNNAAFFSGNSYIDDALTAGTVKDLFSISESPAGGGQGGPYAQIISEFLKETEVLIGQIDSLPPDTVTELNNMYNTMLVMGGRNIAEIGTDMMSQLCGRVEKIRLHI